ncbi:unnamed protein product [Schistosoma curassoni]|uniref:Uncharacterized protein n=1 Tax=Schistosoma curassoni TaxID=6186 RepID=A0A183KKL7_9TREM|nr:unnamed protein product [Schistosoma curassoni]
MRIIHLHIRFQKSCIQICNTRSHMRIKDTPTARHIHFSEQYS